MDNKSVEGGAPTGDPSHPFTDAVVREVMVERDQDLRELAAQMPLARTSLEELRAERMALREEVRSLA